MQIPVDISDWKPAPFDLHGETVFAIGDVHGCAAELQATLATIARLAASHGGGRRRLVFLGDMIDRGPDNVGTLKLWAAKAAALGVDRVDRLMGNHEQVLLLAASGGAHARRARDLWLTPSMGGQKVLDEMRAATGVPDAPLDHALLATSLGRRVVYCLNAMRSHVRLGNTVFVHGGLDPGAEPDEFLSRPWTSFTEARWAWINRGFLDWRKGFNGLLVVHGHTPPALHREISGLADPHAFEGDRLGLDGGTTRTGFVAAAEIRDGRYRVLTAGRPIATAA